MTGLIKVIGLLAIVAFLSTLSHVEVSKSQTTQPFGKHQTAEPNQDTVFNLLSPKEVLRKQQKVKKDVELLANKIKGLDADNKSLKAESKKWQKKAMDIQEELDKTKRLLALEKAIKDTTYRYIYITDTLYQKNKLFDFLKTKKQ